MITLTNTAVRGTKSIFVITFPFLNLPRYFDRYHGLTMRENSLTDRQTSLHSVRAL